EVEHALREDSHDGFVCGVPVLTGTGLGAGRVLGRGHGLIDVALRTAETAVYGESARDVPGIADELAAGADHQQAANGRAAGVGAAGNDRGIGRCRAAGRAEGVQQFGLDLVLETARAARAHGTAVRVGRDLAGTAHDGQFGGVLDQTHLVQFRQYVTDAVRR